MTDRHDKRSSKIKKLDRAIQSSEELLKKTAIDFALGYSHPTHQAMRGAAVGLAFAILQRIEADAGKRTFRDAITFLDAFIAGTQI